MTKPELIREIFKLSRVQDEAKHFDILTDKDPKYLMKLRNLIKLLPE